MDRQIQGSHDSVQWGANLMAHVGQEFTFSVRCSLSLFCRQLALCDLFLQRFRALIDQNNEFFSVFSKLTNAKAIRTACQQHYTENAYHIKPHALIEVRLKV